MCAGSPGLAIVVRRQVQPWLGVGPLTGHLLSHLHRRSSPTMVGALPSARAPLHLGPNSRI